jgi:beta-hydroxylase
MTPLAYLLHPTRLALAFVAASAAYVHFRGKDRLRFGRQITDHSTFTAPYNALVHLASKIPSTPFLDPADFPDMKIVNENWRVFRDEGLKLLEQGKVRRATGDNDLGFHAFFRRGWTRFYLKWYDHPIPSAETLCPRSTEILACVPSLKGAMFAVLPPGGYLGRHRDPFAGALRYHLGLATPNDDRCWIEVDRQRRSWRDGEGMVFDETFVHKARNATDATRLILLCDVERPLAWPMRPINRWVMRQVMGRTGTQNEPGESVGAINRLFARLSQLLHNPLIGWMDRNLKAMRENSRPLYEAQKWATIVGVLALLLAPY